MTREDLERAFKEQALLTRREAMAELRAKVDALHYSALVSTHDYDRGWDDALDEVLALIDGDTQ